MAEESWSWWVFWLVAITAPFLALRRYQNRAYQPHSKLGGNLLASRFKKDEARSQTNNKNKGQAA